MNPTRFSHPAPLVAFSIALALAALWPASAAAHRGDVEVGFGVGATEFDENVADDTGLRGDLRLGYHLNDVFQIEGQFAFSDTELDRDEILLSTLMANAVLNFHVSETVVPYLFAGIGTANLEVDFGDFAVEDDSFAYQGGAGVRFFPGRGDFGVRLEAVALREETFDDSSTHISASLGLTWRFGAR